MIKQILLDQFKSTHNNAEWFVSIDRAIEGLNPQQAAWTNELIGHSVFQLVYHIYFWDNRNLLRFKGQPVAKMEGNNEVSFSIPESMTWEEVVNLLNDTLTGWETAIADASEEQLSSQAHPEQAGSWYSAIANLSAHNAYHIGQIVLIRKLQGSWDVKLGVS